MKKNAKIKTETIHEKKHATNQSKKKKNHLISLVFISVIAGIILGILVTGIYVSRRLENMKKNLSESSQTKIVAPKSSASKDPVVFPKRLSVSGTVENISKSEVSVKTSACQGEKIFTGKITSETKIIRRDRTKKIPFYEDVEIKLSEIEKGIKLSIEAFEDIGEKTEFDAKKMIVEPVIDLPNHTPPPMPKLIPESAKQ